MQGLIGSVFAAGYVNIVKNNNSNGFTYSTQSIDTNPGNQIGNALISAGIGFGFGALSGLLIYLTNSQTSQQYFDDSEYWINDDGISYPKAQGVDFAIIGNNNTGTKPAPEGPIDEVSDTYTQIEHYQELNPQATY